MSRELTDWQQRLERTLALTTVPDATTPMQIAGLPPDESERVYARASSLLPSEQTSAAVLMPIVQRAEGLSVLFTLRAAHLRRHPGQISFPGGRVESEDADVLSTALRETEEEIGLPRTRVQVLGYLPPQLVFTGYRITPVVGLIQPGFELQLDAREVAGVFEVPLVYLMNPAHHTLRARQLADLTLQVYDIHYGEHRIWGATAGMLISLYRLLTD